jgi:hypothetical protein
MRKQTKFEILAGKNEKPRNCSKVFNMRRIKKVDYNEKFNVYYLQYNAILQQKSCSI